MSKRIKFTLGLLIFGVLSLILTLYISLSGGIGGAINNSKLPPNLNSSKIKNSREKTISYINNEFTNIEKLELLKYYGSSTHDQCYKGTSDFKRVAAYAYRCSYRITKYYGFSGNFRNEMINFEDHIYKFGWKPPWYEDLEYPMRDIMNESFEFEKTNNEGKLSYNGTRLFSGLRKPYPYEKEEAFLDIADAEKETKSIFELEYKQNVSSDSHDEIYDNKIFQDIESLFKKITSENMYVLAISIQKDYFRN